METTKSGRATPARSRRPGQRKTFPPRAPEARAASPRPVARPVHAASATAAPAAPAAAGSTQRIVASIAAAIVERRLMPGTRLVEQRLADIFAVSRTIVRQALNQLSRDHLVTLVPARGAFVATPSVAEARQVFEARSLIETAMVRALCERITERQVAQLREHLAREAQAVERTDVPGRTRLLADFHVVLARLLGNDVLAHVLEDLLGRSSLISLMYQSSHAAAHSQAEHVLIVDALERRDARAASRLMNAHLATVERELRLDGQATDLERILLEDTHA